MEVCEKSEPISIFCTFKVTPIDCLNLQFRHSMVKKGLLFSIYPYREQNRNRLGIYHVKYGAVGEGGGGRGGGGRWEPVIGNFIFGYHAITSRHRLTVCSYKYVTVSYEQCAKYKSIHVYLML